MNEVTSVTSTVYFHGILSILVAPRTPNPLDSFPPDSTRRCHIRHSYRFTNRAARVGRHSATPYCLIDSRILRFFSQQLFLNLAAPPVPKRRGTRPPIIGRSCRTHFDLRDRPLPEPKHIRRGNEGFWFIRWIADRQCRSCNRQSLSKYSTGFLSTTGASSASILHGQIEQCTLF
jgi:hypothetical protein